MSSNIKAKNLIYQFKKYDELPYQASQMIDYSANDQYVNAVQLNNTYGQCVDNDLFIAKQMKKATNSNMQIGPTLVTSTKQIDALPDGAKIFDSEINSRIMQKKVASMQESLKKSNNSLFSTVNFIQLIGQDTVLICTSTASYLAFLDEITPDSNFSPSIVVKDEYGRNVVVTAILNSGNYAGKVFAATVDDFNSFSLYFIYSTDLSIQPKNYIFRSICTPVNKKIISISYNSNINCIAFATLNTLYMCRGDVTNSVTAFQIATFSTVLNTGDICTIYLDDSYVLVLTTAGNIYHVNIASSDAVGFSNPSISQISQDDIVVHDIITVKNLQYFATSKGLCTINNNSLHIVDKRFINEINHIAVDTHNTLWFVDSTDNRILSYVPGQQILEYCKVNYNIFDINIICDTKIIIAQDGLRYESGKKTFELLSNINSSIIASHMIVQSQSPSDAKLLVAGKNNNQNLATAKIDVQRLDNTPNYNILNGVIELSSFSLHDTIFSMLNIKDASYAFINTSDNNSMMYDIDNKKIKLYWDAKICGVIKHPINDYVYVIFDNFADILKFSNDNISHTSYSFNFNNRSIIDSQHVNDEDNWIVNSISAIGQPWYDNDLSCWKMNFYTDNQSYKITANGLSDATKLNFTYNDNEFTAYKQICFLATLSSSSNENQNFQLAKILVQDDMIYLKEAVDIGISSNVIKYQNDDAQQYLAIKKDNDIHGQLFGFSTKMTQYDNVENALLQEIIELSSPQIVDNIYLYLSNESTDEVYAYRRADYIVPGNGNNISVLRSTCKYDTNENDFIVDADSYVLQEILSTSGIKSISHRYANPAVDDSVDIYCIISGDTASNNSNLSAIYVRSMNLQYAYDNPNYLFTKGTLQHISCVTSPNVKDAILYNRCLYDHTSPASITYKYSFSSFEIHNDDKLYLYTYWTGNAYLSSVASSLNIIDINNFTPLRLARSLSTVYVLGYSTTDNTYKIYQLSAQRKDNISAISADFHEVDITLPQYASNDNVSFVYTYNDIDPYEPYVDNSAKAISAFSLNSSNSGGILRIAINNNEYLAYFDADENYTNLTSQINVDNVHSIEKAMPTHMTPNAFANCMFTDTIFNDKSIDVLFYNKNQSGLYQIDSEKTICTCNTPTNILSVTWVGKNDELSSNMIMQKNTLSILQDSQATIAVQMPEGSSKPQLIQCYDKEFSDQQNILFSDKYSTKISSISQSNNELSLSAYTLLSSPTPDAKVLNRFDNNKAYPYISYLSSISLINYDNIVHLSASFSSILSTTARYAISKCALNANSNDEMYIVNKPAYSPMTIYKASFGKDESITQISSFNNLIDNIVFSNNIANLAYAIANGSDTTRPIIAILDTSNIIHNINVNMQLEQVIAQSTFGYLSCNNETYYLYAARPNSGSFVLQFSNIGNINNISKTNAQINDAISCIFFTKPNEYIIQCDHSILKYNDLHQEIEQLYSNTKGKIGLLNVNDYNNYIAYYSSVGNEIISSLNLRDWTHMMYVGISSETDSLVTSMQHLNSYVILCNKKNSLDDGLFYTYYTYSLVNNTAPFTPESAFYMYNDNISAIEEYNDDQLSFHINTYHLSTSNINMLNNYMDTDFEISGFMKKNSAYDVQNDYIEKIIVGNQDDENILAFATNSANSRKQKNLNCNYIAKCWKSGFTELYIYLPTTYTYYIPHIEGTSNCIWNNELVEVNGRNLAANIHDNVTAIRINLMTSMFTIDTLLENTIKVNSLPLQIYKDNRHSDISSDAMFHTFICPSVAQEFNKDDEMWGYQTLNYYCFGSDAQAIKLSFINSSSLYSKKRKIIVYHANGGFIPQFSGMKSLKQYVYEGEDPTNIYWAIFQKDGAFFSGWSPFANAIDNDDAYTESSTVSYDSMQTQTMNLYACWISYEFGTNDTQITISNVTPKNYTIAEITIDPNAKLQDNTSLGNTMIIDYGD